MITVDRYFFVLRLENASVDERGEPASSLESPVERVGGCQIIYPTKFHHARGNLRGGLYRASLVR